ncbi:hypothetical protein [Hydrogenimonas cancrithermarum]|uniref:Uncharacterized protein n=1 Tax=Hydrogenimonas cancrithermarum TaxID=2993563 RepID=A0ABN6WWC6_9BACT|nr:hypothetical protein [Hydrogenimonas cancrithermarum]BDY13317.1 hypothetical protein HCR_16290 [Hydrogenimonas cancrithermarum]
MIAFDYIEPNYKYIAIFTNLDQENNQEIHKKNLNRDSREGYSGNWIISQNRIFQKVLLYVRENGQNKIYLADYLDREIIEANRSRIYFTNLKLVDTTNLHWGAFTESNNAQSPVRYIEKKI